MFWSELQLSSVPPVYGIQTLIISVLFTAIHPSTCLPQTGLPVLSTWYQHFITFSLQKGYTHSGGVHPVVGACSCVTVSIITVASLTVILKSEVHMYH